MKVNLEKIGLSILMLFGVSLMTLMITAISSTHNIEYYYLDSYEGGLRIRVSVDWSEDKKIALDRAVSYEDAIEMVDKLNKTVK